MLKKLCNGGEIKQTKKEMNHKQINKNTSLNSNIPNDKILCDKQHVEVDDMDFMRIEFLYYLNVARCM